MLKQTMRHCELGKTKMCLELDRTYSILAHLQDGPYPGPYIGCMQEQLNPVIISSRTHTIDVVIAHFTLAGLCS